MKKISKVLSLLVLGGLGGLGTDACLSTPQLPPLTPTSAELTALAATSRVSLAVDENLGGQPGVKGLIAETARQLLGHAGSKVLPPESTQAEARLSISVSSWVEWPRSASEADEGPRRGGLIAPSSIAEGPTLILEGAITWELGGKPVLRRDFMCRQAYQPGHPREGFEEALSVDRSYYPVICRMIGDIYGPEALIKALGDQAWRLRSQAARTLGRLKAAAATRPLVQALADPQPQVRQEAAEALKSLTGQDFGRDREAWANWLKSRGL